MQRSQVIALVFVALMAFGMGAMRSCGVERVRASIPAAEAAPSVELQPLIDELRRLVEVLDRPVLHDPSPATVVRVDDDEPARTPAVATEPATDVDALIVELRNLVRALSTTPADRGGARVLSLPSRTVSTQNLPSVSKEESKGFERQHLFMTEQELLDRYGLPDRIRKADSGAVTWTYQEKRDGDLLRLNFVTDAGRVISFYR